MARKLLQYTALFIFWISFYFLEIVESANCVCKRSASGPRGINFVGEVICMGSSSLKRDFFLGNDACKGLSTKCTVKGIKNKISLTRAAFSGPSFVPFDLVRFESACIDKLESRFFGDVINTTKIISVTFNKVRCLKTLGRNVFNDIPTLQTLEVVESDLESLDSGAFNNLQGLRILKITNTKLTQLAEASFLTGRSKLNEINLSDNRIETLHSNSLDIDIPNEVKLDLSNNKIKELPFGIFKKLKLQSLKLENNRLIKFPANTLNEVTLRNIKTLSLQSNLLAILDRKLIEGRNMTSFFLNVDKNPWNCVCQMQWTTKFHSNFVVQNMRCQTPPELKGKLLTELTSEQFCPPTPYPSTMGKSPGYVVVTGGDAKSNGSSTGKPNDKFRAAGSGGGGGPSSEELIAIGVAVAVIVVGLVTIFLFYRYRSRLCSCSGSKKSNTTKGSYHAAAKEEDGYNGQPLPKTTYVV